MTQEEARKLLPVIQAFAEGKKVQALCATSKGNAWIDEDNPTFTMLLDWRIKPEPFEAWVNIYDIGYSSYTTRYEADAAATPSRLRCIKVREVEGE